MVDPKDKEPAEGSRETIDKELARREQGKSQSGVVANSEQKRPAQPRSTNK